jgi:YbbR domain-containing protein
VPTLRRLTQNWKLKLLALALAVLLWVVVSADQVTSNWIPVPLQVRVLDPSFRLIESSAPGEVEVRFTGPGRDFLDLAIRRSPLLLNIDQVRDTVEAFELDPGMVQVPNQLSVNPQDVRPGRVSLRFLQLEDRVVPLRVRVRNELGSEWTLVDSLRAEPARIRIRGPARLVAGIQAVATVPVTLSPGDSAFSRLVEIDTTGLAGLELSTRTVRVSGVVDRIRELERANVPVSIGGGLTVRPATVTVRLRGPEQIVRAMAPATFRVVVAIDSIPARIPEGGVAVPVRIEGLPPRVTAAASPATVRLIPAAPVVPDTIPAAAADTTAAGGAGGGGGGGG